MQFVDVRTKREGHSLTHPTGPVATNAGGRWPNDQFTARRLRDDDIEIVENDPAPQPTVADAANNEEPN